jgi:peptidoglycan hydrolase CwlO-like protein
VLSSESLAEMESRLTYLSSSEKAQAEIFEALAADRTELEGKIRELEEAEAKAAEAKRQLAELRVDIEAKVADQRDEIAELNEAIERAEARERAREEAARRAALEAQAEAAQATRRAGGPNEPSSSHDADCACPQSERAGGGRRRPLPGGQAPSMGCGRPGLLRLFGADDVGVGAGGGLLAA